MLTSRYVDLFHQWRKCVHVKGEGEKSVQWDIAIFFHVAIHVSPHLAATEINFVLNIFLH